MEQHGQYYTANKNDEFILNEVSLDPNGILQIFSKLKSNPNLSNHFDDIEAYDYKHKYKPYEFEKAIINIQKQAKKEKRTFKEVDASGCDSDLVTKYVDIEYYSFDILNEEATILYNLLMRLELEDYEAASEILTICNEMNQKVNSLEEQIKDKYQEVRNNDNSETSVISLYKLIEERNSIQNSEIFSYYNLLCNFIKIESGNTYKLEELERQIEEAEAIIRRNEAILSGQQSPFILKYKRKNN